VDLRPERRLTVFAESTTLLRKPSTALQRKRFPEELEAFRDAAAAAAAGQGFELLHVPVSVHLHVHAPEFPNQPQLPPIAKAHLDALEGIAYCNDRQVEHLVVRQDALAHPMMDGYEPGDDRSTTASVFVDVEPVSDYTDRYDKAFRMSALRRSASAWRRTWGLRREVELQTLYRQRRNATDSDERLDAQIRHLEHDRLLDGVLADIDRPGPLRGVTQAIHALIPAHRVHWNDRRKRGLAFRLPLRGDAPGTTRLWQAELDRQLKLAAARTPGLPLRSFISLDIAVRGESLKGKDLDNLAHAILGPLEAALCVRRGTVVDYRAYTAVGEPEGVEVRVIDHLRLLGLDIALGGAQTTPDLQERLRAWADRTQATLDEYRQRSNQ
jgi:hypothetical protein